MRVIVRDDRMKSHEEEKRDGGEECNRSKKSGHLFII
jgi:hypothetical protein